MYFNEEFAILYVSNLTEGGCCMCFYNRRRMGGEIKAVSNLIQRNTSFSFDVPELTRVQGWIVGFIRMRDNAGLETFQKDVEKAYEIRRSTATGILQLLEKKGYLERQSVSEDARLKKLVLTAKAIEVHDQIIARIDAFEAQLSKGISEEDKEVFFRVMDQVKKNLNSEGK